MSRVSKLITDTRAYSCLDCGKCTVACPISRYDSTYSPRNLVNSAMRDNGGELLKDAQLWSCITCSMCEERCQSGVRYTELMKSLRSEAYEAGNAGQCTHGGALQSLMHIMAAGHLDQNRLGWLDKSLKTTTESDVLYFAGCQPYFDVIFSDTNVKTLTTGKSAIKLLNHMNVVPAMLPNERCCGHDLLWAGDTEHFLKLAEHNVREIRKTGARQVVTTCPECYHTLKVEYPRRFGDMGFEVIHMSQLLAEGVAKGELKFRRVAKRVTYHDPCRLGRFSGIYDEPRSVINAIPGLELIEMPRNRTSALCCGTQAWINCGAINKQIQNELLAEAQSTEADLLLTACPKCQIHLRCAMNDGRLAKQPGIEIIDVVSLAAKALIGQELPA